MPKNNKDFFVKKKIWSEVKDELLGCYLKPYIQKILTTGKPLFYVDCFAGKGKFDDGKSGSPLIALENIGECLRTTRMQHAEVKSCFIDLNYARDLEKNLADYKGIQIVSGKYEEEIEQLLRGKQQQNVFLYVDPYGIMALDCGLFDSFADAGFYSIELLINMNSFGFIREACRALRVLYDEAESFEEIEEYYPTVLDASVESIEVLNSIAGGSYWQKIVRDYNQHRDGRRAEREFVEQYCLRLGEKYKYVLNMPMRVKKENHPKYRMIHMSNHPEGCLLMCENIANRWELWRHFQRQGQTTLFMETVESEVVDEASIKRTLEAHLVKYSVPTSLAEVQANFFTNHGVLCKPSVTSGLLRELENEKAIEVVRDPATTPRTGKPSTFFTETAKQHVLLRVRP